MVVQQINVKEVVSLSRRAMALPGDAGNVHDEAFLAALVRRAAGILCPCSERTIFRAVLESLQHLADDAAHLETEVENAVEKAMIAGDLLEFSQATTSDPDAKGTWVFAAPPSFVARPNGSVFLMGIAPDEPSPLAPSLSARILYERHFRLIHQEPSENLPQILRELGVLELSEQSWLKLPKEETAKVFLDRLERELMVQPTSGSVPDLLILDSARDPSYYKGRWVAPRRETGCFVARRPQAYGAPLWGFAHLADGALDKFLDFPPRRERWRGCDFAWHLQLAIDSCRGSPQKYRRRQAQDGICLDFFSPLPLWAERRLAIIGRPAERSRCLFTYQILECELAAEEEFLRRRLWLAPTESSREKN
jgi:hypothetical protein